MRKNYVLQTFLFVLFLTNFNVFSKEGKQPDSKKIEIKSNAFTSSTDPGWSYTCDDGIEVELLSVGLKNNVPAVLNISNVSNVTRVVVEIVYKGRNPGNTIEIQDAAGNNYTATREVPSGGSPNVWYYRAELPATSVVNYTNTNNKSHAQSMLAYVFREMNNGTSSTGVFTAISGYNDIQTTTIPIQTDSGPRTVTVELPISELTPDGRYIHIEVAAADGSFTELTEAITPSSFPSGTCCIKVFELVLTNVAGNVDEIEIKIDTRANKNGQSVNGQSWVMGGAVKTNVRCSCVENDTELPTADNLVDHILVEDMNQLPIVTFSDNCSNVTIEYNEYESIESCEIDFGPVNRDSNIGFTNFPYEDKHHWNKGYYILKTDVTTKIVGSIENNAEPNSGWVMNIDFEVVKTYSDWINSGGFANTDNLKEQRFFGNVDFSKQNRISGFGNYKNSNLSLISTSNLHYMDVGPKDTYGAYGIGFYATYQGSVNGQAANGEIEMIGSLKKCVTQREATRLLVREWIVTDAAGNTGIFIQRVEIE